MKRRASLGSEQIHGINPPLLSSTSERITENYTDRDRNGVVTHVFFHP